MSNTPNPGSAEAIAIGCSCPRIDNGHGRGSGFKNDDGSPAFWVRGDCPVHGVPGGHKDDKCHD